MAEDTRVGTEVAGYRIEAAIGRGGMGAVYLAEHLRLARKVALKLLAPELAGNEKFRERFLRESRIAASIDHPNIVPIYDADEADGVLFIAMRYVEGTDLRGLIAEEGRLDPARTASITEQVADALDVAHARGLVHRDVKPANVLLVPRRDAGGRDHAYLSDFGLTKRALSVSGLTQTGQIVGTIDYVAPEQVKGDPVDGRVDQYSLGCVIYQCLTGEVPFPRDLEVASLWAHVQEPPPSLVEAGFDEEVDAVIGKALAKEPADRFDSCGELASSLSAAVGVEPRPGRARPVRRPPRRRRARILAVGIAAGLVLAAVGGVFLLGGDPTYVPGLNTVTRIDADSDEFDQPVHVGENPNGIAPAGGTLWVTNLSDKTVQGIDPTTGDTIQTPESTQGSPTGIAGGSAGVFITTGFDRPSQVLRINPNTLQVESLCEVPSSTYGIAEGSGSLWLAVANQGEVWRVDPAQCGVGIDKISLGQGADPEVIATGGDPLQVWVGDAVAATVYKIDPASLDPSPFSVSGPPTGIAISGASVWISIGQNDEVALLDTTSGQTRDTINVGESGCDGPKGIAIGGDGVWVGCAGSSTLVLIDPDTHEVVDTLRVDGSSDAVVADENGDVWVSVHEQ